MNSALRFSTYFLNSMITEKFKKVKERYKKTHKKNIDQKFSPRKMHHIAFGP